MYVALGGLTGPAIAVAMVEKRSGQRKGRFSGSGREGCGNAMCNAMFPPGRLGFSEPCGMRVVMCKYGRVSSTRRICTFVYSKALSHGHFFAKTDDIITAKASSTNSLACLAREKIYIRAPSPTF
jgi:hypothetical protein